MWLINKILNNKEVKETLIGFADDWLNGDLSDKFIVFLFTITALCCFIFAVFLMLFLIKIGVFIPLVSFITLICLGISMFSKFILKVYK